MPCTLAICNQCYKEIESNENHCLDVCIAICDAQIKNKSVVCNPIYIEDSIEILERKGFIKTMEVSETEISIRLNNFKTYGFEDSVCFCWCVDEK